MGEHVQRLHAFAFTAFFKLFAEYLLFSGLVSAFVKFELAALLRLFDAPSSQNFGELRNVFLRVTAINAERVEFHDLARVVLI